MFKCQSCGVHVDVMINHECVPCSWKRVTSTYPTHAISDHRDATIAFLTKELETARQELDDERGDWTQQSHDFMKEIRKLRRLIDEIESEAREEMACITSVNEGMECDLQNTINRLFSEFKKNNPAPPQRLCRTCKHYRSRLIDLKYACEVGLKGNTEHDDFCSRWEESETSR